MAHTEAGAIVRELQALRIRYRAAGRLMEAKGVERSIRIARAAKPTHQIAQGDAIAIPVATPLP